MDQAVARAYGWDFPLDHEFHPTRQGIRYTLGESARHRVLDELLHLNHQRHAAETSVAPTPEPRKKRPGKKIVG